MPPNPAIARDPKLELRRRTFIFSVLGLLLCVILVAIFEQLRWVENRAATMELLIRAQASGRRFDMSHAPSLLGVGVLAGVLAGMLGMGGGVLKVAGMLVVFQLDILLARAVSLTTMFLATASASLVHWRQNFVLWSIVRAMLLPASIGVLAGMFLGHAIPRVTLTHFFAFFALFLGFNTLGQAFSDPHERAFQPPSERDLHGRNMLPFAVVGGFHGFVCGLLGISGGVLAVPLLQALAMVSSRQAVAISVAVSAFCTAVGSVAAVTAGHLRGSFHLQDVVLASSFIGGGAIFGAQIGARLTGILPVFWLKLMFVWITFTAGLVILIK
ncbi:MAG: sulfite exporter TauE/SafE family protein [Myxococcales bacterium]|nr:sulfite exporter TauE/SafE family protein [Myxococcales bacterium]